MAHREDAPVAFDTDFYCVADCHQTGRFIRSFVACMAITVCTTCNGDGLVGRKVCGTCRGTAAAAELADFALYWGKRLDPFEISLDRVRRFVSALIILIVLTIGISGVGTLVWYLFANAQFDAALTMAFWNAPQPAVLFFWIGCLSWVYLMSRIIRDRMKTVPVRRRSYRSDAVGSALLPLSFETLRTRSRNDRVDCARAFTSEAFRYITSGYERAHHAHHATFLPVHLILSLMNSKTIQVIFGRMGVSVQTIAPQCEHLMAKIPLQTAETPPQISPALLETFFDAYADAFVHRRPLVSPLELFAAAIAHDAGVREVLYAHDITEEKLKNVIAWIRIGEELRDQYRRVRGAGRSRKKTGMNRAMTAQATPTLDRVSEDITLAAARGHIAPIVDRDAERATIYRIFEGGGKSVLLVGEHGTGKEALIHSIALAMVREEVPAVLTDRRMVSLSVPQLVSGVTPAEAQARLLAVLHEVARSGNIILVVPNVHEMIGVSLGEGSDLADAFANEVSKGYFLAIAETSPQEYAKLVEQSTLGRTLEIVKIDEMNQNAAIQALEAKSGHIEYQQKVFFTYDALEKAVTLSTRYIHDRFLPEKAIEIVREAAQSVRAKRGDRQLVKGEDVAAIIAEKTKVPVTQVTAEESQKLLKLEDYLHERVIGQDEAVKMVSAALRRSRAELRSLKRPIANFLFLGPTGVGKTELTKAVAESYFGREDAMVRLDMSEYQDQASIHRLIGAPGETGGGVMSEAVRKQPFTLLLLDELEKAHKDVLNVFLQVMDDGRLTDNGGRVIDFTNVILVATSNAGSQFIQDEVRKGAPTETIKDALLNEQLKNYFRPEFLNRFDGVIVFRPLTRDEILQITWLMIEAIAKRLETKGILLEVQDAAAEELANAGFDPVFGARPLRRVISEKVENALADFLLTQKLGRRDKVIFKSGGVIEIKKAEQL